MTIFCQELAIKGSLEWLRGAGGHLNFVRLITLNNPTLSTRAVVHHITLNKRWPMP